MSENVKNVAEALNDKFRDLPMLHTIFQSFIDEFQIAMRRDYNMPIEIYKDFVVPLEINDYKNDLNQNKNAVVIQYKFHGWNAPDFYTVISKKFVYKIIEFVLGGDKIDYHLEIIDRPFSKIEQDIVLQIIELVSASMQNALLLADSNIKIVTSEIYFDNNYILPNSGTAILSKANVHLKNWDGFLDLVIPYESLLPIKTKLMKSFSNLKLHHQDEWRRHLYKSVAGMEMNLTVEIDVLQTFEEIQKMSVGDTIITEKDASESFEVKINGKKIHNCKIGKLSENIAVEITDCAS